MEQSSSTWTPERVLGDRAWIRRIALELAGDASLADDLAQEAWLAAAERPPREPGALAPWLRGVLKRLARQTRRARTRRDHRERSTAVAEALPATDELVLRAELQRRVAEAVVALAEPYRSVVLLRYFEGLSSAEIARRQGVPAATVRAQLARGLARLREELDERQPGGRAAWLGLFTSWLGAPSGSTTSSISILGGVLAMKGLFLAGLAAAALFGLWFGLRALDARAPAAAEVSSAATPRAADARDAGAALVASEQSDERSVDAPLESASEEVRGVQSTASEAAAIDEPAVVEARLVDEHGRPLAGATLELSDPPARAKSDASGRVRLEVELEHDGRSVLLIARSEGRAARSVSTRLTRGEAVPLGDLALVAAGSVSGRVIDASGAPLADVQILATGPAPELEDPEELRRHGPRGSYGSSLRGLPECRSSADGAFRVEGVPAGAALVWAGGGDYAWSSSGPLAVSAGEALAGVELALEELATSDRIEGLVLSPEGDPVPSATLVLRFEAASYSKAATFDADENGGFSLLLDQRVPHSFEAKDPEGRWSPVFAEGIEPGTRDLVLRFVEARWIAVAPRRADGEGVLDFTVAAERQLPPGYWDRIGDLALPDESSGRAQLSVPTVEFRVVVDAPGFALATLGPFDPVDPPAELEVALEALPGVHGRVFAQGEPVAGAYVQLHKQWPSNFVYTSDGFRSLIDPHATARAVSDASGRFRLDLREAGSYLLRAEEGEWAPAELWDVELEPQKGARDLELAFAAGGVIEGRLVPAGGADPEGRVVGIHHGDDQPRTVRVGADGRYRFEGLSAGMWQVIALEKELDPARSSKSIEDLDRAKDIEWSCEVFAGETTWFDLSEEHEECTLDGRLSLGTAALAGWTAELVPPLERDEPRLEPRTAPLDADGRFRLVSPRGGTHALKLRAPGSERGGLVLELDVALEAGANTREIELPAGSLSGEGAPVGGGVETQLEYRWSSSVGLAIHGRARIVPEADGRFALPLVPAGEATIRAYEPGSGAGAAASWTVRAQFSVPPGGSEHVVLGS